MTNVLDITSAGLWNVISDQQLSLDENPHSLRVAFISDDEWVYSLNNFYKCYSPQGQGSTYIPRGPIFLLLWHLTQEGSVLVAFCEASGRKSY